MNASDYDANTVATLISFSKKKLNERMKWKMSRSLILTLKFVMKETFRACEIQYSLPSLLYTQNGNQYLYMHMYSFQVRVVLSHLYITSECKSIMRPHTHVETDLCHFSNQFQIPWSLDIQPSMEFTSLSLSLSLSRSLDEVRNYMVMSKELLSLPPFSLALNIISSFFTQGRQAAAHAFIVFMQ